jgi:type I restriction enzyme M protein
MVDEKGNVIMMKKEETITKKDSTGKVVYRKETRQVNGVNDQTILVADIFAKWKKQECIA